MERRIIGVLAGLLLLGGCNQGTQTPAPIGDLATLERLADSYQTISAQFDSSPSQLSPEDRKRFVEFVFKDAGYDYGATLDAMAHAQLDPANQNQRDLAELLFFPHAAGSRQVAPEDLYSAEELEDIRHIQTAIN